MTTPAQPESKTRRTDAACLNFFSKVDSENVKHVSADFARQLETELIAAHIQAEADRREIERLKAYLRGTEASHVEACFKLAEEFGHSKFSSEPPLEFVRKQLATAQQRIKELEADGRRLDWLEKRGIWSAPTDEHSWAISVIGNPGKESTLRMAIRAAIDSAMSREPKEGEAK